jgi:hypothetical protein
MQIRIKMALHGSKFDMDPIFETECRFDNDQDQQIHYLEEMFRFIMSTQLQKEQKCASVSTNG